jgi:hypothetical protein
MATIIIRVPSPLLKCEVLERLPKSTAKHVNNVSSWLDKSVVLNRVETDASFPQISQKIMK